MSVVKVTSYEFADGTDVAFRPSTQFTGRFEAWLNGVYVETMTFGDRPSEVRARYYREVHLPELATAMESGTIPAAKPAAELACAS